MGNSSGFRVAFTRRDAHRNGADQEVREREFHRIVSGGSLEELQEETCLPVRR